MLNITNEISARFLASVINNEEIQDLMQDEFHQSGPLFVTEKDILNVLEGKHEGITAEEVIAVVQVVCAVMSYVCPLVNGK